MKVHTFFIRITKFCRGSFLIFRLLQPQFVVSFVHISVRGLKGEIKTKRQGIWKQCWLSVFWGDLCTFIQDYYCAFCPLLQPLFIGCRGQFFGCRTFLQLDSIKFQLETFSLFITFSLSLFLNSSFATNLSLIIFMKLFF